MDSQASVMANLTAKSPRPVIQEWVQELSLMQQSVLLSAIRGCDGIARHHKSKALVKWYRRCVLLSAFDGRALLNPYDPGGGSFAGPVCSLPPGLPPADRSEFVLRELERVASDFIASRDELPAHYQVHMMHAIEIVGYKHPLLPIRTFWHGLYERLAHAYHLWPETEEQLDTRLGDTMDGWLARGDPSLT